MCERQVGGGEKAGELGSVVVILTGEGKEGLARGEGWRGVSISGC